MDKNNILSIEKFNNAKSRDLIELKCSYCSKIYSKRKQVIVQAIRQNNKNFCSRDCEGRKIVSKETRDKMSDKRKKYLADNPDKHVWKRHDKFKSVPCEKAKEYLKNADIIFAEEFTPLKDRAFSIDIAFPDKMIGLEINGNQHYNSDGTLKDYYAERVKIIENTGWKLYQIHYSLCFDDKRFLELVKPIIESPTKIHFDYQAYISEKLANKPKLVDCLCQCGCEKNPESKLCRQCNNKRKKPEKRKCVRPSLEVLHWLFWNYPKTELAKIYGVSDNAIKKWCEDYGIAKNQRGYWAALKYGAVTDYQI